MGGQSHKLGGQARNRIGRLSCPTTATPLLTVNRPGTAANWLPAGPGPEVTRVTIEASTNGITYTLLGEATPVPGGWQVGGLGLPWRQSVFVRARGSYMTGIAGGSGSLEQVVRDWYLEPAAPTFLPLTLR